MKKRPMTDEELMVALDGHMRQSISYFDGDVARERATAMDYYLGRPFGNEVEGHSQVVSREVFDTIEGMLPSLVNTFAASSKAVEFLPHGLEDEAKAKQATSVANYVFYRQNPGVVILYQWFKDALLQKNGVVTWYYEEKYSYEVANYANLTDDEFTVVVQSEDAEVLEHTEREAMIQGPQGEMRFTVHDAKVRLRKNAGKICVKNVPPEEFFVSPKHNSIFLDDCEYCEHRRVGTRSELLEMGFDPKVVESIGTGDNKHDYSQEWLARNPYSEQRAADGDNADSLWFGTAYVLVDFDGDGVVERRRIFRAGNTILENEEVDHVCFATITPILMPHQWVGLGIGDVTMDFQLQMSTLLRQMFNNLYLTNNPRVAVVTNQVNLDDLLTSRPGGVVRMNQMGAAQSMDVPFVAGQSFPMLEYLEGRKESRTGVTRYNQGTDADTLNKTARGISIIQNASQQRLDLIARLFAETGVKELFRGIMRTAYQSGLQSITIPLEGKHVAVDPREFDTQWNMTVNVGLGTGNKDRQIQMLQLVGQMQSALQQAGKGYMVSEQNLYTLAEKIAESAGFSHAEAFFTPPQAVPPQAKQMPPPIELVKLQADQQGDQMKQQLSSQFKQMEQQTERYKADLLAQIEKYKADLKAATDTRIAEMDNQTKLAVEKMGNDAEANKTIFEASNDAKPVEAAARLDNTGEQLVRAMEQLVQAFQQTGQQIVQGVQQQLQSARVVKTEAVKGQNGKTAKIRRTFADGSTDEVENVTIQ